MVDDHLGMQELTTLFVIRVASGAGFAANPPAQPAPQTRVAEADHAALLAVPSGAASPQPRILSLPTRFNVLDFSGRQSLQSGRQEQSRPRWQGTAREVRASLPSRPPARKPGGPHLDGGGRELCVARLLCGEAGKKGGLEIVTMDLLSSCGRSGAAEDEVVDLKVLVPAGFERRLDLPGEWIRLCC